ncbi:hypothetical protein BWD13_14440 [Leptospira santarosai serovar Grippotyphosa]|nr:hypothetical protein BWD13_14440 [Leptospira santarosai serovar Grippotyphosa]
MSNIGETSTIQKDCSSLRIAHLCFAKNLRLRSAIYGYLALYGSQRQVLGHAVKIRHRIFS